MNDPVGTAELAVRLGVERSTVYQWRRRGLMPEPDLVLSGTPVWEWSTVEQWAAATGRLEGVRKGGRPIKIPGGHTPQIKLVVAGNYRQFVDWCKAQGFSPHSREVRYIDQPWKARGYHNAEVIKVGTYYQRKDIFELLEALDRTARRTDERKERPAE